MPNAQKMDAIFQELLKKFESAEECRIYATPTLQVEERQNLKTNVANFKKRFEEAKNEADPAPAP